MKKIPMTLQGSEKLKSELEYLKKIRRNEIIKSIKNAREHGDLKENAEYHAAREEQGFCERRIQEIENILSNAQIIEISKFLPSNRVIFGATVSIKNINNGKIKTYRIVGDDESDCKKKLISINSPMARGLIGKEKNNIVIIKTPCGEVEYKIIKVDYL